MTTEAGSSALTTIPIETSLGTFVARFSGLGLAEIDFPSSRPGVFTKSEVAAPLERWVELTRTALESVFHGRAPKHLPPLDLSAGSRFRQRVWKELLEIPVGVTASYGEISARLGKPKAARAVGGACSANRIPVLVPCHRVVAHGGGLGGFSAGLQWKRRLLEIEGTLPAGERMLPFNVI